MATRAKRAPAPPATTPAASPHHTPPALARMEARLRKLLARGESVGYEIGLAFGEIARAMDYRDAGFATLEEYANARFPQGYTTLKRYRTVASVFAKRLVLKHGMTKLSLGLEYIALTPEHERPSDLLHVSVKVPGRGDKVTDVVFGACTAAQLVRAIEHARKLPTAHDDVSEARAKRAAIALQALVAAPKGVHRHAPLVRTHLTDDRAVRYDLLGIDEDDLERVARGILAMATSA